MATRLERNLRESSIDAFILALEIINKLSISYRLESFVLLFCNAWELLLKAKLLREKKKIFYRKKKNQSRRSISLNDCLNRVFTSIDDPIRLNIEKIAELRNNAIHLVVPFVSADVMALFQAGVLNYTQKLNEWFGIEISKRVPLGMMSLVCEIDPSIHSFDSIIIKRSLPMEAIKWWKLFQESVRNTAQSFITGKEAFYIPITLKLALVKNPNKADIVLGSGTVGENALILEVPKNPDITHPYRCKEVVQIVNQRLNSMKIITTHDVLCVRKVFKIDENNPNYYYKSKFASPQYSNTFIDWLIEQFGKDHAFFDKVRTKYKEIIQRKT